MGSRELRTTVLGKEEYSVVIRVSGTSGQRMGKD